MTQDPLSAAEAVAAYDSTRALLSVQTPQEATAVLLKLVRRLGGDVVAGHLADASALPFDLSFKQSDGGIYACADLGSDARARLQRVLPDVVQSAALAVERAGADERLAHEIGLDPLTRLMNRDSVSRVIGRLQEGDVVAVLDLDRLGQVNESFGRAAGDETLRGFGRVLRRQARQEDIVGRLDSDTIVILLRGTDHDGMLALLKRVRTMWMTERVHPATFSAGIADVGADGGQIALTNAQSSLMRAKRSGRDRFALAGERTGDQPPPSQDVTPHTVLPKPRIASAG